VRRGYAKTYFARKLSGLRGGEPARWAMGDGRWVELSDGLPLASLTELVISVE
jgi:hypothetical protein